jgi:hypothetical protein
MVFVAVLGITIAYIGEAISQKDVQAQESIQHLSSDKNISTKARIERLDPDGEIEWSLEADRMEFSLDDDGEIAVIDCFGNVRYSRGNVIVRSVSGRFNMARKRFTFGDSDEYKEGVKEE